MQWPNMQWLQLSGLACPGLRPRTTSRSGAELSAWGGLARRSGTHRPEQVGGNKLISLAVRY